MRRLFLAERRQEARLLRAAAVFGQQRGHTGTGQQAQRDAHVAVRQRFGNQRLGRVRALGCGPAVLLGHLDRRQAELGGRRQQFLTRGVVAIGRGRDGADRVVGKVPRGIGEHLLFIGGLQVEEVRRSRGGRAGRPGGLDHGPERTVRQAGGAETGAAGAVEQAGEAGAAAGVVQQPAAGQPVEPAQALAHHAGLKGVAHARWIPYMITSINGNIGRCRRLGKR